MSLRQDGYKQSDIEDVFAGQHRVQSVRSWNAKVRHEMCGYGNFQDIQSYPREEMIAKCWISAGEATKCHWIIFVVWGGGIMGSTFPGQPLIRDCSNIVNEHDGWLPLWRAVFTDESRYILDRTDGRQRIFDYPGRTQKQNCHVWAHVWVDICNVSVHARS